MMKKLGVTGFDELLAIRVLSVDENTDRPRRKEAAAKIAAATFEEKRGLEKFILDGEAFYASSQQQAVKKREIFLQNIDMER